MPKMRQARTKVRRILSARGISGKHNQVAKPGVFKDFEIHILSSSAVSKGCAPGSIAAHHHVLWRKGMKMSTYIVVRQSPKFHQMSIDEMLGLKDYVGGIFNDPSSDTRTYVTDNVNKKLVDAVGVDFLIKKLHDFNEKNGHLIDDIREYESIPKNKRLNVKDRVYYEFLVPKHDGKMRTIDAPREDLSEALRELRIIFENYFHALYHTSAFAYVKNRSIVKCLKRHQNNESQWYAKFDLHGFFPSTTEDFVMNQFSMVFPFSEVIKVPEGREELRKALNLAFLDGGLPQGTPISPLITNVMMIPIDYQLYKKLRDFNGNRFVYTRYADDFTI